MACNVSRRIGLLIGVFLLALLASLRPGRPRPGRRLREPQYADEILRLVVKDLEVQALGEAPIRIERTWKDGRWVCPSVVSTGGRFYPVAGLVFRGAP